MDVIAATEGVTQANTVAAARLEVRKDIGKSLW
jgi:hypothetical protein